MDDYSVTSLNESRNEWCSRLINILTPLVIEGFRSIFDESYKLCIENGEEEKYLMTYQNFLARIPKWNSNIVDTESKRIIEKSNCGYLNDLISCVHIIQLKSLSCMRVGTEQKKIDINIPPLNEFIHKVYINCARKTYTNIYLFEKDISPLQVQKHNRELELIVREQILDSIRENIPVEEILKVYLDESIEDDVQVEEKEEIISTEPIEEPNEQQSEEQTEEKSEEKINLEKKIESKENISFKNTDQHISIDNVLEEISAPKTDERLDEISQERHEARKREEDDDDDEEKLTIGDKINLDELDVHDLDKPKKINQKPLLLDEIEVLT